MKTQEITGTLVLIDPGLDDPAKGQGMIAIVNYESLDDLVYVSLENGKEAIYNPEDLLKLKPKEDIIAALMDKDSAIHRSDYIDLYKITLLQERETAKSEWQALEIVQRNEGIRDTALQPAKGISQVLEKSYTR
jgi:hypothetical protein